MVDDSLSWTPCREPGCTMPAETLYQFNLSAVSFDGSETRVWFERRACVEGHYLDVEVYEDGA